MQFGRSSTDCGGLGVGIGFERGLGESMGRRLS